MTRSYYDIIGVKRTATSREIRAAYLGLIKRYHPDVAGSVAPTGGPDMIALLNRCYAVLKDPRKRAEYDAQLSRQSPPEQTPVRAPRAVVPHEPNKSKFDWRIPLIVAALAGLVALLQLARNPFSDAYNAASLVAWGRGSTQRPPHRHIRGDEIARVTRLATSVSADEAESISSRCFAAAEEDLEPTSAKLCIVFDDALLYWRQNANEYEYDALPLYFREEVTRTRHLDALGGTDDAERSLAQLRDITFRALLSQLKHAPVETADAGAPAAQRGELENGSGVTPRKLRATALPYARANR